MPFNILYRPPSERKHTLPSNRNQCDSPFKPSIHSPPRPIATNPKPAVAHDGCVENQKGIRHKLPEFARHLANPIVTLYVGEDNTEYHVHEDTLCQLPFFRAALQGQFKEASEKKISMPDDDPAALSALIQQLYTGKYTYDPNVETGKIWGSSEKPSAALVEALFHLEVWVIVHKYGFSRESQAETSFHSSLAILSDLDRLRIWKAAYATNVVCYKKWRSKGDTSTWLDRLFNDYPEELRQTLLDCPELAYDLLRATTIGQ